MTKGKRDRLEGAPTCELGYAGCVGFAKVQPGVGAKVCGWHREALGALRAAGVETRKERK